MSGSESLTSRHLWDQQNMIKPVHERIPRVKTIYLCGPINGRSDDDCNSWRRQVTETWPGKVLDPMRRDYRGHEHEPDIAAAIVAGDLEDLVECDALVVYFDKPSVGTSMEIFHAHHNLGKPVVLINKAPPGPLSPWLKHHSDYVALDIGDALLWLREKWGM